MSFKSKSLLVLALLQSLLLAAMVWAGYAYYVQEETGHFVDRLVGYAQGLAATASDAVVALDLATLDRYTQSVRDSAGLAYVRILDAQGRMLSGAGDAHLLQRPFSGDQDFTAALHDDGVFDQWASISLNGQVFGRVELGLEFANVSVKLAELRRDALLVSLTVVLLMILATAILLQLMTRPLSRLALAANGIAEGDYSISLPTAGRDEIGQLAASFASMREQVKCSQQALKSDALREARHAQELMDNVMDGIISIDEQGLICNFNPAAERIFGYAREEVLGQNVSLLMPEPFHSQHDGYLRNYQENGEKNIIGIGREVPGLRKDGSLFSMDLAVNATEVDGRVLFTGIIRDITERRQTEAALALQQQQLEIISHAQAGFIVSGDPTEFFENVLQEILTLAQSEYGLIGEVMQDEQGEPYIKAYAISNIAWDGATRKFYAENAPQGLEFHNIDNLLSKAVSTGEIIISNNPVADSRAVGIPPGHPPLNAFLGVPIYHGDQLLGMIGLSNRPGGYDDEVVEQLRPILSTCSQLLDALGRERDRLRTTHELQRANDLIESVLANLWAGMVVEDESRRILSMNPAYRKLFAVGESVPAQEGEDGETEIQRIRSLFADPDAFEQQVRDCLQGQRVVTQVELPLNDGRIYELEYIPIISSDDSGVDQTTHLWSYRNVTQRKQVEVQLRRQTEDLLEAKDLAEAADKAKGQFLATMSHEIRTPLNGVLGMMHLLGKTPLSDKQQHFVSIATGSGEMLLAVINDILDYSKLEAGKLELENIPFDPLVLVEDTVALMAMSAQEKGLALTCATDHCVPRWVRGDPTRLRQVLTNLISNAIKFTEQGDVVAHLSAVENEGIHFSVQDSGIGITSEQQQRLFKSFSQVDSSHTRKYGGTGLGLAICQRLVAAMGSEIRVVSTPGQGSDFSFRLFLASVDDDSMPTLRSASGRISRPACLADDEGWWFGGRRLLLAEDNPVNQEVAREILTDVGFHIEIRENGLDALQAVQEQDYDAVLMDIQMPVMDGLEAARQIRALGGRFTTLPIIAMTAHALIGDSDKSLAAGMNDHVTKPIDPERLLEILAKWLQPTKRQAAETDVPEIGYLDTAPEEMPDLPGIDVADGLTRLRGNLTVYRRILLSFRDQQADAAVRLQGFIAAEDWKQAASLAHALKGSGGNLGAKQLYAQAASMEQACRSGDAGAAQAGFEALRTSLAEVMGGLEALARLDVIVEPSPAEGESRRSDPAVMHALIGKLLGFLDSDLGEAQTCIDALRACAGSDYVISLNELEGALNRFDIEAAKEVAQRVRNTL